MLEQKITYGPFARGLYIAFLWAIIPVGLAWPDMLMYYIFVLVFLGLGLRPLLEISGLYKFYLYMAGTLAEKRDRRFLQKRSIEIDRKTRNRKYRDRRTKDPRLPEKW